MGLLDAEGLADTGMSRDDAQFIIGAYQSLGGAAPTPVAAHAPLPAAAAAPTTAPERDADECPICFEPRENRTALVPCGHILCGGCAAKYNASCPVCREAVSSRMRVFR